MWPSTWPSPELLRARGRLKPEAIMRSDSEIERDVRDELQWDPDLDATDIAVSVKDGVVTLAGYVKSYTDKYEAEAAAKRVVGVTAVANDLEVRLPSVDQRPDPDIARDAVAAIKSQLPISSEHIKAVVKNGWVSLAFDPFDPAYRFLCRLPLAMRKSMPIAS
jgi:osmotically-inducible protein OsmY